MYICISVILVSLILRALARRQKKESKRVVSTWDIIGGEFVEFTPDEMSWRYSR